MLARRSFTAKAISGPAFRALIRKFVAFYAEQLFTLGRKDLFPTQRNAVGRNGVVRCREGGGAGGVATVSRFDRRRAVGLPRRYFYVRRLKDERLADIGTRLEAELPFYAALCGRTLARAHARSGDAVTLSGYMGDDSEFDKAIAEFAMVYADQTKHDWRGLLDTIKAGRIAAETQHVSST